MQEEYVRYNHGHDAFIRCRSDPTESAGTEEQFVRSCQCGPDVCGNADATTEERDGPTTEDISRRDDDEICIPKCDYTSSGLRKMLATPPRIIQIDQGKKHTNRATWESDLSHSAM